LKAMEGQRLYTESIKGVDKMTAAVTRYLDANRDLDGFAVYPGDGVNMAPLISPDHGYIPPPVRGQFVWEAQAGMYQGLQAIGICMRPIVTPSADELHIINKVRARLPAGATVLANNCYAGSDAIGGATLTYWLPLNH